MDVIQERFVVKSLALHGHRLVPVPEETAPEPVPQVEAPGISVLQPLHPRHQIGFRRLDGKMVMVPHQDPRMHAPPRFLAGFGQGFEEKTPVIIVPKDPLPPIATRHHMVKGSSIFDPYAPGHEGLPYQASPFCQELQPDPLFSYVWDAANRLTAVNEPGGGQSQFTYDGFGRRVQITESTSGTVTSTKNLVWDGMGIAEETNSSNVVTKIYFREGVQVSGSDYYYTRDHLGSIREITATTGTNVAIVARYDYDPYGQQTQLSGTVTADFGFTGHYIHQPSGLLLAPYRAYSTSLGRWISRDPIAERGGINLYQYAGNDPIAWTDPTGLIRGPFPPQAPLEPGIPPLNPGEGPIIQINPPVPGMGTVPAQPMAPTPTPTPTPPTPTPTPTPTPSSPSPSCSPSPAK